jgi:glycosyltransferase involved in cell wall biosynthesis
MSRTLSVVIPVYNEAAHLAATVDAVVEAIDRSDFDAEVVVVDDGSTDGSAAVAEAAVAGRVRLRVLSLPRGGRFKARRVGVEEATSEWVLLLDARVRLRRDSLRFLAGALTQSSSVWNGHVTTRTRGNPFGAFGNVLVHIAWATYFDNPESTSYGLDDFDYFPKGTGCFLAPKAVLLSAMDTFSPLMPDWRLVSDDTQLIRGISAEYRIHLSPAFGCDYQPRTSPRAFLRQATYRGATFLDGHGRRESRFYPLVVAFYPLSIALGVLALRRPLALPVVLVGIMGAAAALSAKARRPLFETASFAVLSPIYAIAHGAGMWRAIGALAKHRLTGTLKS